MSRYREGAYALLRFTLGVVFLFSGIGKLRAGVGNVAGGMLQQFSGKLPGVLVQPFVYVLPFAEAVLGAMIVFGLFTRVALSFSGLLLVALTFGTVMLGEFPTVAHNTQYALVNFVLLWASEYNHYSIDHAVWSSSPTLEQER